MHLLCLYTTYKTRHDAMNEWTSVMCAHILVYIAHWGVGLCINSWPSYDGAHYKDDHIQNVVVGDVQNSNSGQLLENKMGPMEYNVSMTPHTGSGTWQCLHGRINGENPVLTWKAQSVAETHTHTHNETVLLDVS